MRVLNEVGLKNKNEVFNPIWIHFKTIRGIPFNLFKSVANFVPRVTIKYSRHFRQNLRSLPALYEFVFLVFELPQMEHQ